MLNNLNTRISEIGNEFRKSINPPEMNFNFHENNCFNKKKNIFYLRRKPIVIFSIVFLFVLFCGFAVKKVYFDSLFFNSFNETGNINVINTKQKNGEYEATLLAAFSDSHQSYIKIKIDGPINELNDISLVTEENKSTEDLIKWLNNLTDSKASYENAEMLANKIESASIFVGKKDELTTYIYEPYIKENDYLSKMMYLNPISFSHEYDKNETILTFNGKFESNEIVDLRIKLNGIEQEFLFEDIVIKENSEKNRDISSDNIVIDCSYGKGSVESINYGVFYTELFIDWDYDKNNYSTALSDYVAKYYQKISVGDYEENIIACPSTFESGVKIFYATEPNQEITISEYDKLTDEFVRAVCIIPAKYG